MTMALPTLPMNWNGITKYTLPSEWHPCEQIFIAGDDEPYQKGDVIFVKVMESKRTRNYAARILAIGQQTLDKRRKIYQTAMVIAYYMKRAELSKNIHESERENWSKLHETWIKTKKYYALTNELGIIDVDCVNGRNSKILSEIDNDYVFFHMGEAYQPRKRLMEWKNVQEGELGWWTDDVGLMRIINGNLDDVPEANDDQSAMQQIQQDLSASKMEVQIKADKPKESDDIDDCDASKMGHEAVERGGELNDGGDVNGDDDNVQNDGDLRKANKTRKDGQEERHGKEEENGHVPTESNEAKDDDEAKESDDAEECDESRMGHETEEESGELGEGGDVSSDNTKVQDDVDLRKAYKTRNDGQEEHHEKKRRMGTTGRSKKRQRKDPAK